MHSSTHFKMKPIYLFPWPKLSGIQICTAPEQAFSSCRHLSAPLLQWSCLCKSWKGMSCVWSALQLCILLHLKNQGATGRSLPGKVIQPQYSVGIRLKQSPQKQRREAGKWKWEPYHLPCFLLSSLSIHSRLTYWTSKVWRLLKLLKHC